MLTRRHLLAGAAAAASGLALPHPALGAPKRLKRALRAAPPGGYDTASLKLIAGKAPGDLEGVYYLNGPARHELGGARNGHWFDGDGMVHAFRFSGGRVAHRGRYVQTTKYVAETEAGRFLYPGFGSSPTNAAGVGAPDDMNVANISVLPLEDEVLALWEGGSAYALAPVTLDTIGPKSFAPELQGAPFSAHPRIAADGTIWNFGHDPFSGRLAIYELDASGGLKRWAMLQGAHGMMHDFVATERHLVFVFPPFEPARAAETFLGRFAWKGDDARTCLVVSKATLEVVRRHETPAAFQFHHFNASEDASGSIRFGTCSYADDTWMQDDARAIMDGVPFNPDHAARYEHITLHGDGRTSVESDGAHAEFPVFRPEDAEARAPGWCTGMDAAGSDALVARDADGAVRASWSAGPDTILGEHVFAGARPSRYLVGTQFDAARGRTLLSVFRADAVADGPAAIWALPKPIPLPLHGRWG